MYVGFSVLAVVVYWASRRIWVTVAFFLGGLPVDRFSLFIEMVFWTPIPLLVVSGLAQLFARDRNTRLLISIGAGLAATLLISLS